MRRGAMRHRLPTLALLGALLLAGLAWAGLGAARDPTAPPPARAAAAAGERPPQPDALPPLPRARPRAVEPVAGEAGGRADEADPVVPVEEDATGEDDAKPTRAASTKPRTGPAASATGDGPNDATALPNGVALPPLEAPEAVLRIIEAGNAIAKTPYKWGGGHGKWQDTGYDCSGSVSFALASAGLLGAPLASGPLMRWGKPGKGRWVTVYSSPGHVYMEVAGIRFDTSGARVTGSRWQNARRSTSGFVARHPPGL